MSLVFADTFYWVAITNFQDPADEKANSMGRSLPPGAICTTEEVLTEYLNYFAAWGRLLRSKAAVNVQILRGSKTVEIVPQTADSFAAGFALYRARLDKGYSLTDCISMETMGGQGIADALTNDAHFEQEGYRALFRSR
jgi:uncharacterized protein